jgi:uncharacterized protein DUF2877
VADQPLHLHGVAASRTPASASVRLRAVLQRPERPARLLGLFPAAAYLAAADGTVVTVCAHDAVRLPNALVLTARTDASPLTALAPATEAGAAARVGDGGVTIGTLRVQAVRWWTPPRPAAPRSTRALRTGIAALRGAIGPEAGGLPARARCDLAALSRHSGADPVPGRAATAALALLGLGPGLTPSGDDVLCGFLLALRHLTTEPALAARAAGLGARVAAHAAGRTTDLSAALLGHAARGDGCAQLIDLISAVGRGHGVLPALRRLLTVGHTSGADLTVGVLAGAEAAATTTSARSSPEGRSTSEQRA